MGRGGALTQGGVSCQCDFFIGACLALDVHVFAREVLDVLHVGPQYQNVYDVYEYICMPMSMYIYIYIHMYVRERERERGRRTLAFFSGIIFMVASKYVLFWHLAPLHYGIMLFKVGGF